jgi:hypothetical protein
MASRQGLPIDDEEKEHTMRSSNAALALVRVVLRAVGARTMATELECARGGAVVALRSAR